MADESRPTRRSYSALLRSLAGQGTRMALLSAFSLGLGYFLTSVLKSGLSLQAETAFGYAVLLCSIVNFFGCRHFVFIGPKAALWREALKFFPSVLLFRAVEVALFSTLYSMHRNYHIAYFATAAISMVGKLLLSRFVIFKRPTLP